MKASDDADKDAVDFYHAVSPTEDNKASDSISLTPGEYTVEVISPLNSDGWAMVVCNASGSYTFNRETAKEYVEDNLDLLHESCEELGIESNTIGEWFINQDYETMDVTIRCYLLSKCIHTVINELTE